MAAQLLLMATAIPAHAFDPQDYLSKNYSELREWLAFEGWLPAPHNSDDDCFYDNGVMTDICTVYPEMRLCAGTGLAPCVFEWARGNERLVVGTVGELPKIVTSMEILDE